ncbi:MAG: DUF2306 domain-containing protein [Rhizobiaceae bacterium]|nr:DUF2306 domain-containing protein [Rhizobiaceae bacterium]
MNVQAFLHADPVVQVHMISAFLALFIGSVVFLRPKGTPIHKRLGRAWMALMLVVSLTGLFIHEIRTWGLFSPIHIFSIIVPISLTLAVYFARKGRIGDHKRTLISVFIGGNIIAGGFTFLPGRLNYDIFLAGLMDVKIQSGSLMLLSLSAGITVLVATIISIRKSRT